MSSKQNDNRTNASRTGLYAGFAGLPPLAGLATMEEAIARGLTVSESVARLKRLHWALKRLHGIFVPRITAMPIYEVKMAFCLHAHYCIEHAMTIASRIREMRQPPYGLEVPPNASLDLFFDEILSAPTVEALILGLYGRAIPAIIEALTRFLSDANRLFDHPSYRVCRLALVEMADVQDFGKEAIECLVTQQQQAERSEWLSLLDRMLASAGGLDGAAPKSEDIHERQFSATPYKYDPVPKRDERFQDSYNMGVNAEAMLFDPETEPLPKTIMLYFKRMREIDVPEMMASILYENQDKPWQYKRDLTRQLWDEARHAMMGEVGFVSLGIDWTKVPFNITFSLNANTKLTSKERHAVLYTIEQSLMPRKTGKEYEWEVAVAAEPLAARIQDYDWADEVLHARIGREWLVPETSSQVEALAFGNQAWARMFVGWRQWRDEGMTEHRNWWPEVYLQACRHWGVEPDSRVLAYDKTYETATADLAQYTG